MAVSPENTKAAADDRREPIFLIESPSSDDLYEARNEGDSLVRTLSLGGVEAFYYLATNRETFERSLNDITIRVNDMLGQAPVRPFIHISAHGSSHGIELTDLDEVPWLTLTRLLRGVHELIGPLDLPKPFPQNAPRICLCLSSCSAFKNYVTHLGIDDPFHTMIGPNEDVGWCQSLIGFSTFYYQSFVLGANIYQALDAMNVAAAGRGPILFEKHAEFDWTKLVSEIGVQPDSSQ